MHLNFDLNLSKKLREKINEISNFAYTKTADFQYPGGKKGDKKNMIAFNCICAVLDRIDDLARYCNSLEITKDNKGIFEICNLFNYGQTLIDCIAKIADIYGIKLHSGEDCDIFNEKGLTGKGSDTKYFKYLRSICSVHPINTNGHKEYQGNEPEWCPYIQLADRFIIALNCNFRKNLPDFLAIVYRNDNCATKKVPIYIKEVFQYLEERYNEISKVIIGIDEYNSAYLSKLKSKKIKGPEEYVKYIDYLKNLFEEMINRCGSHEYCVKECAAILETHFSNSYMEKLLDEYKKDMKTSISHLQTDLQYMNCISDEWEPKVCIYKGPSTEEISYATSKLNYLYPAGEIENNETWNFKFISSNLNINKEKLHKAFSVIEHYKSTNINKEISSKDIHELNQLVLNSMEYNDSEWARIQLKIIENIYGKDITFDYSQNDWHLWLQIQISNWLYNKNIIYSEFS